MSLKINANVHFPVKKSNLANTILKLIHHNKEMVCCFVRHDLTQVCVVKQASGLGCPYQ